jgi:hypothetical protein
MVYCKDNFLGTSEKKGMSRDSLFAVVVTFDLIICLFYLVFTFGAERLIN